MRLIHFVWPALLLGVALPGAMAYWLWPNMGYEQVLGQMAMSVITGLLVGMIGFLLSRRALSRQKRSLESTRAAGNGPAAANRR